MIKNFIDRIGAMNCIMLVVVLSIIVFSEYLFLSGEKLDAIFVAFWAPHDTRFYELPKVQEVMDLILSYSIFVGVVFMIWLVFVVRMYRKFND